jgi:hypothetical protein
MLLRAAEVRGPGIEVEQPTRKKPPPEVGGCSVGRPVGCQSVAARDLAFYGVGRTVSEKPDKWNGWGWLPVDSTSQP